MKNVTYVAFGLFFLSITQSVNASAYEEGRLDHQAGTELQNCEEKAKHISDVRSGQDILLAQSMCMGTRTTTSDCTCPAGSHPVNPKVSCTQGVDMSGRPCGSNVCQPCTCVKN